MHHYSKNTSSTRSKAIFHNHNHTKVIARRKQEIAAFLVEFLLGRVHSRHPADGSRRKRAAVRFWSVWSNEDKRFAMGAFTYDSRDLGGVSSLNPHPSTRENITRLMICLTRGRGCWLAGWRVWRREQPEETPTAGIALLLFILPRPLLRPSSMLVNHSPRT